MTVPLHRPERLDFLCLRFTAQAQNGFQLENPFSDLHGGFGLMLHAHAPLVFRELFAEQSDSGMVRGYVLRPGAELMAPVAENGVFSFDLTLYGVAVRHAAACMECLGQLGVNGLTRTRHHYRVEQIVRCSPASLDPVWTPESGWQIGHLAPVSAHEILQTPFAAERWRLQIHTPLILKSKNVVMRYAPQGWQFLDRLFGRAQLLATQQSGDLLLDKAAKQALWEAADQVKLTNDQTDWQPCSRHSAKKPDRNDFGGLTGHFELGGLPEILGGWLNLMPWLHVGSKTGFGLGHCEAVALD